jgi:hypothetical protein
MVQLSATKCSCIDILWVNLVSFSAIILCVASQRVFIVVVYFVIVSVRKLLDITSYIVRVPEVHSSIHRGRVERNRGPARARTHTHTHTHACICMHHTPKLWASELIKLLLHLSHLLKEKVKLSPCLAKCRFVKTYLESGSITPHILNLSIRWRWVVTFTPRPLYSPGRNTRYPLNRRLGGTLSRSGRGCEGTTIIAPAGNWTTTVHLLV